MTDGTPDYHSTLADLKNYGLSDLTLAALYAKGSDGITDWQKAEIFRALGRKHNGDYFDQLYYFNDIQSRKPLKDRKPAPIPH